MGSRCAAAAAADGQTACLTRYPDTRVKLVSGYQTGLALAKTIVLRFGPASQLVILLFLRDYCFCESKSLTDRIRGEKNSSLSTTDRRLEEANASQDARTGVIFRLSPV